MWRTVLACALLAGLLAPPAAPYTTPGATAVSRHQARALRARSHPLARERDGNQVPRKLLLQSAIQAQLSYCNEFKNELMTRWLESFLGHEHLRATRTGDMTSTIKYRGLDGLRCDWQDYLRTMLSSGPQQYTVRYRVGTPDLMPRQNSESASTATATGEEPPWAAASRSRRNNPYLKDQGPQYKEYTETIEPRRVARGLMQIRAQLAQEWLHDLRIIAADDVAMRTWLCGEEETARRAKSGVPALEPCVVSPSPPAPDAAPAGADKGGAEAPAADASAGTELNGQPSLPLPIASTFAEATRSWSGSSTPFRVFNYDMLQRALLREATLRTLRELDGDGGRDIGRPTVQWLQERFEHWRPRLETPRLRFEGALYLLELMGQGPVMRTGSSGKLELIDPSLAVDELLIQRQAVWTAWCEALEGTADEHANLLCEDLKTSLDAPAHGKEAESD